MRILEALILLALISTANAGPMDCRGLGSSGTVRSAGSAEEDENTSVVAVPSVFPGPESEPWTLAKSTPPDYTIRRTVPEVRLQFSVADEHGRLVTSLTATDFRVFDDRSVVPRIRQFSQLEDLPLQLGILLDVSDSVHKTASRERVAAQAFAQHVLHPQTDRAFVMAFAQDVKLWQPATGDPAALHQALDRIRQVGDATNLFDGLFSACYTQFRQNDRQDVVQRIIVLLSDGTDTGSLHGIRDVISLAQRHEIQIFALAIHARRKPDNGDNVLRTLADETGGGFYVAASDKDFPAIFTEMEQQMRTQYAVSFQPQQETPGFHALRLELTGPQKRSVHARQGYYIAAQ